MFAYLKKIIYNVMCVFNMCVLVVLFFLCFVVDEMKNRYKKGKRIGRPTLEESKIKAEVKEEEEKKETEKKKKRTENKNGVSIYFYLLLSIYTYLSIFIYCYLLLSIFIYFCFYSIYFGN